MCGSVLQCVDLIDELGYERVCRCVLPGVLQCVAMCCSVLQSAAVCCSVLQHLKWLQPLRSVASGNRALMLLEGKRGAYIRDTGGFAKWDTSGPTAVLDAYGGTMSKLPPFLKDQSLEGYTHLKSSSNLDFVPGQITMTLSNAKDKSTFIKGSEVCVCGGVGDA